MTVAPPVDNNTVPVYVPGEVVEQAYVIPPTLVPEVTGMTVTNDMIKTFSIARTVKFLTMIDMFFSFIYCFCGGFSHVGFSPLLSSKAIRCKG